MAFLNTSITGTSAAANLAMTTEATTTMQNDANASLVEQTYEDLLTFLNNRRSRISSDVLRMRRALEIIQFYVIPSVCALGLAANVTGINLIVRDGLRRSSNILLIALSVSDTGALVGFTYMSFFQGYVTDLLTLGRLLNELCYYLYIILVTFLIEAALICSYNFTVLITVERLLAVYFPLKFNTIVTPLRTLVVVLITVFLSSLFPLVSTFMFQLSAPFKFFGMEAQVFQRSPFYLRYEKELDTAITILNEFTGSVPITIITLGSIAIGVRVKVAAMRRAKITHGDRKKAKKDSSQRKTTRTLLAVCVTFVSVAAYVYIYEWVWPEYLKPGTLTRLIESVNILLFCINCSINFFIYVLSNDKFRRQFLEMLACSKKAK